MKKRTIGTALAAISLASVGAVAPMQSARASTEVSGHIMCTTKNVNGVWIAANGGHSGWAQISPGHGTSQSVNWWYDGLGSSESYRVHVGCGGVWPNWEVVTESKVDTVGNHDFNCIDDLSDGTTFFYKTCSVVR